MFSKKSAKSNFPGLSLAYKRWRNLLAAVVVAAASVELLMPHPADASKSLLTSVSTPNAANTATTADLSDTFTTPGSYKVKIVHGIRKAESGKEREYTLYVPQPNAKHSHGPFPLVVLIHGFLMTGAQQSTNAQNLAERGFVVLTPNLTRVLLGDSTRMENVHDIIDHIKWLTDKSSNGSNDSNAGNAGSTGSTGNNGSTGSTGSTVITGKHAEDNPVAHQIDAERVAIAGNSSGGAVILEVALEAQKEGVPIAGLLDLDGTIWERSFERVPAMKPLKILSLRCEPSFCNEHARQLVYLRKLTFPIDDVKVIGSHHCDVENPTTLRCRCACGASHDAKFRRIFAQLIYTWLRDNFNNSDVHEIANQSPTFSKIVQDLEQEHVVAAQLNRPVRTWLASTEP